MRPLPRLPAVVVALAGASAALAPAGCSPTAGSRGGSTLALTPCQLRHPLLARRIAARCGTLEVPEDHDRLLWAWLSKTWAGWRHAVVFVKPSTAIAWQRRRYRDHWARLSRTRPGRPRLAKAVQDLIREIPSTNPRWGSPRIVGELSKWTANQISEAFPWEAAPR